MQDVLSLCAKRSLTIKTIGSFQGGRGLVRGAEGPVFSSVGPKKMGDFLPLCEGPKGRDGRRGKDMVKEV